MFEKDQNFKRFYFYKTHRITLLFHCVRACSPVSFKSKQIQNIFTQTFSRNFFKFQSTYFQEESGKICGTWQQLPRRYRKQLRKDDLYVQLTNENGDMISGRVAKHFGLRSELFSALITSDSSQGTKDQKHSVEISGIFCHSDFT